MATATMADDTLSEELVATNLHPALFLPLCWGSGPEQTSHDTGLTSQKAVSVFQEARAQVRASLILSACLGLRFHRRRGRGQLPCPARYLDTQQDPGTQARPAFSFFPSFLNTTIHSSFPGKGQRLLRASEDEQNELFSLYVNERVSFLLFYPAAVVQT